MNIGDTWYFAYGSNLSLARKQKRTGAIRKIMPCRLLGYRFAFNKDAGDGTCYANIIPEPSSEVLGAIYLCDPIAMGKLDKHEGVALGHYRRIDVVVDTEDGRVAAIAYVACDAYICDPGRPRQDYFEHILRGAKEHGLSEEYLARLVHLATG